MRSEKENQQEIRKYLNYIKAKHLRINQGYSFYSDGHGHKQYVQYGEEGASDLIGIVEICGIGIGIAIETKTEKEYKRIINQYDKYRVGKFAKKDSRYRFQKQIQYIEDYKNKGAIGLFAFHWKQVHEAIEAKRKEILEIINGKNDQI